MIEADQSRNGAIGRPNIVGIKINPRHTSPVPTSNDSRSVAAADRGQAVIRTDQYPSGNATQKNEIQLTACSVTLPSIVHTPGYQNVHTSDGLSEMIRSCRIEPFEAVNRTKRFAY